MLARRLRVVVVVAVVLATAIAVIGVLPGTRHYRRVDPCAPGVVVEAVAALGHGTIEHPDDCRIVERDPDDVRRACDLAGGLALLLVLAPALWVARRPSRSAGWAWVCITATVAAGYFVAVIGSLVLEVMFGSIFGSLFGGGARADRVVTLWPGTAVLVLAEVLAATLLIALPAILLVTRDAVSATSPRRAPRRARRRGPARW